MEQEIKLLHFAKLLQELHQVVPARIQAQHIRQDRPMCYVVLKAIPFALHKVFTTLSNGVQPCEIHVHVYISDEGHLEVVIYI